MGTCADSTLSAGVNVRDSTSLALEIRFEPRADGSVLFRVERSDGTSTWQKHERNRAAFFVLHDLTHYAVETVLFAKQGFFGLLASGWDIEDTTGKGRRGALPDEAIVIEHIVGTLDIERSGNAEPLSASQIREILEQRRDTARLPFVPDVTASQLTAIHARISELTERWMSSLSKSEPLTLTFEVPVRSGLTAA